MFDVFRFAWFAVRTFAGVILLMLALHAALWMFVKLHSMASRNVDPDAALRRVMSYNARANSHEDGKAVGVSPTDSARALSRVNQKTTDERVRGQVQ